MTEIDIARATISMASGKEEDEATRDDVCAPGDNASFGWRHELHQG